MTGLELFGFLVVVGHLIFAPPPPLHQMAELERQGKPVPAALQDAALAEAGEILAQAEREQAVLERRDRKREERRLRRLNKRSAT